MIKKYMNIKLLEERNINTTTGKVWSIFDVPYAWKETVTNAVIDDGYYIAEDGTVYKEVEKL